jgi:hypothetical protein
MYFRGSLSGLKFKSVALHVQWYEEELPQILIALLHDCHNKRMNTRPTEDTAENRFETYIRRFKLERTFPFFFRLIFFLPHSCWRDKRKLPKREKHELILLTKLVNDIFFGEISGLHGNVYEGGCLLRCCDGQSSWYWPTFQRFLLPPSSPWCCRQ